MSDEQKLKVVEEKIELEPIFQPLPEKQEQPVRHDVHFRYGDWVQLKPDSTAASLAEFYGQFNKFQVCAYSAFGPAADQVSYEIVHYIKGLRETRINVMANEIEATKAPEIFFE